MPALLGTSILELRTDNAPLAAGLKESEALSQASLKRNEAAVAASAKRIGQANAEAGKSMAAATGDTRKATSASSAVSSTAADLAQTRSSTAALKAEGAATAEVSAAQAALSRTTSDAASAHQRESAAARAASDAQTALGASTARTTTAHERETAAVRTSSAEHKGLINVLEQVGYATQGYDGKLGALGRSLDDAARHANLFKSKGVDYLATGLAGGAVALVAFGTKVNLTFDTIGKEIQQQAGTGSKATQQLLDDVKQVGEEAPESWQEIGQAVAAQYRLFGSSNAQIKQNTDLFMAFASSANTAVVPAITSVSNIMRAFGPSAGSAESVMDRLVNLSQKSQRPLGDLLNVVSRYAPQFQAMGLSLNQTIGLMDAFSRAGISTTSMGRGFTTMLTKAASEQKAAGDATGTTNDKMLAYRDAVESAQEKVDSLNQKIASGKGDQETYNEELSQAQDKLQIAKDKMDQYKSSTVNAGNAQMSIAQIIAKEAANIEGAKTKQDALNLAVQYFGGRIGPQMADALYGNKAALDQVDKSLGDAHGKTEDLAAAQRDTLHGQVVLLEHDFDLLASKVGLSGGALKDLVGDIADVVKAIANIPTPVLDLLVYGGGGAGALTLLARHSPLGADAARLFGGGNIAQALFAQTPTAQARLGTTATQTVGEQTTTTMEVGTLIAKNFLGASPAGSAGNVANTTENDVKGDIEGDVSSAGGEEAVAETGLLASVKALGPKVTSVLGDTLKGGMITAVGGALTTAIGSAVGGKAGKDISKIGNWGSIGAGIGTAIEPGIGTAVGAAIGAGIGIATSLIHSHNYGRSIADAIFDDGFGGEAAKQLSRQTEDALNQANSIAKKSNPWKGFAGMPQSFGVTPISPGDLSKMDHDAQNAGTTVAKSLEKGWQQYKYQDPQTMLTQLWSKVKLFPNDQIGRQAKAAAVQSAVQFAEGLVSEGKLSQSQFKQFLDGISKLVPGWRQQLQQAALASSKAFADGMNLTQAESNLKSSLTKMRGDFPVLVDAMDRTKGDMVEKAGAVVQALEDIERKGGPQAKLAAQDITDLRTSAVRDLTQMAQQTGQQVQKMHDYIVDGNKDATTTAVKDVQNMMVQYKSSYDQGLIDVKTYQDGVKQSFQQGSQAVEAETAASYNRELANLKSSLASRQISQAQYNSRVAALDQQRNAAQATALTQYTQNMVQAMEATGGASYSGVKAIVDQFNQIIGPLGGSKLPEPHMVSMGLSGIGGAAAAAGSAASSSSAAAGGGNQTAANVSALASGGVMQIGRAGEGGHDTVPLNVGGNSIVVGRGEQVAVFNRHQIPQVNQRFSDVGGLPGFFRQNTRPNYAATGGVFQDNMPVQHFASGGLGAGLSGAGSGAGGMQTVTASQYSGGTTASGADADTTMGYAELSNPPSSLNFSALGHLPMGFRLKIDYGGRSIVAPKIDVGMGGDGLNGTVRAVDLTPPASSALGFSGLALVQIAAANGQPITVGTGTGGAGGAVNVPTLTAPKVAGGGTLSDIVQKGLNKVTQDANAKLQTYAAAAGGTAGAGGGTPSPMSGPNAVEAMVRMADSITAKHYPYVYGGGHSSFNGPYDCSGSVSAVLHAAGLLSAPEDSTELESFGQGGAGKYITIYANPAHAWMTINGHAFSTSDANGGGAGWMPPHSTAGFVVRHPPGLATGGVMQPTQSGVDSNTQDTILKSVPAQMRDRVKKGIQADANYVLPGMAQGGLLGYFTSGGTRATPGSKPQGTGKKVPPSWSVGGKHKTAPKPGKQKGLSGKVGHYSTATIGTFPGGFPFSLKDLDAINNALSGPNGIFSLVGGDSTSGTSVGAGGDAQSMSDLISIKTSTYGSALFPSPNFSSWDSPSDFVITQDQYGNAVTPYISTNINTVGQQLQEILGYQTRWVNDLTGAVSLSKAISGQALTNAIAYRTKEVTKIQKKVQENIARIKRLQALIKQRQKQISDEQKRKSPPSAAQIQEWQNEITAERKKKSPDQAKIALLQAKINAGHALKGPDQDLIKTWQTDIKGYQKEVGVLQAENMGFVGNANSIPGSPGGEMGEIQGQLGLPSQGSAIDSVESGGTSSTGLYQLRDTVNGWVTQLGGADGDVAQQTLQEHLYAQGLNTLAQGASVALSAAAATSSAQDNSNLVTALENQLAEAQLENLTRTAQSAVMEGVAGIGSLMLSRGGLMEIGRILPFGGSFAEGGTVPGAPGQPVLIEAHGGEQYLGVGEHAQDIAPNLNVIHNYANGMEWLHRFVETKIEQAGRKDAYGGNRRLPSGGGGQRVSVLS